jgi:hypothetical protein
MDKLGGDVINVYRIFAGYPEGKRDLRKLSVCGRIILKRVLKK